MAMSFEEAKEIIMGDTLGEDFNVRDYCSIFIVKDDGVLTGREQLIFLINELVENYVNMNVKQMGYIEIRNILIEFANSKNAMRRDMTVEQIVDEFLENN